MVKKVLLFIFACFVLVFFSFSIFPYFRLLLLNMGVVQEEVSIAGTGSMYPTFPKGSSDNEVVAASEIVAWPKMRRYPSGIEIFGSRLFSYEIRHGDIIEFENERTKMISKEKHGREAGFVKRVIALPRDTIDIRDGFIYLNNKILDEPYTAKPRSTYGGSFLADCRKMTIPNDKAFVLGDNRKASLDSRFDLELVDIEDINFVLSWDNQEEYRELWRDTKDDAKLAQTSTLDPVHFLKLLNEKRKNQNLKPYKYNSLLSNSGKIRGSAMIKYDDFSQEATRSGVTLKDAVRQAGYQNIIFAEVYTRGYYEAQELLENFLEFPETKKILFSKKYQDVGISSVWGEIAGCPLQVIVTHLGGYVPPNYTNEEIESWQRLIENLEKVLPSWQALKDADSVDQGKVKRLINLLNTRLDSAGTILSKMQANQWLDNKEREMVKSDKNLAEEIKNIIDELMKR